jgi:uncharacterized protein (TIGR00730 family)
MAISVAVFCGSREGRNPAWRAAAQALGQGLGHAGMRLIYGGGRVGLMGAVADATLAAGGEVLGVIPEFLTRMEVAHTGLSSLEITDSMHTRKRRMFDCADAFVTLPGGLGTLDETMEIVTWRQLGLHRKPVLICNVEGWADSLLGALDRLVADGFADATARNLYEVLPDVSTVLARLAAMPAQPSPPSARL